MSREARPRREGEARCRAAWVRVEPQRPLLWLKRKDAECVIFCGTDGLPERKARVTLAGGSGCGDHGTHGALGPRGLGQLGPGEPGAPPRARPLFTGWGVFLGNRFALEEEESDASVQKRKRKKKKKNHLQPERVRSGAEAGPPPQNGAAEPGAGRAPAPEPGPAHGRRKRPRRRSPRVQDGSAAAAPPPPLKDAPPGDPRPARAPAASGAPVPKRKRKLGALPVNGSGPPALAWPLPLGPGGRLKRRKGEPGSPSASGQKAAILKRRKRTKEAPLVRALVRQLAPVRGGTGLRGTAETRAPDPAPPGCALGGRRGSAPS